MHILLKVLPALIRLTTGYNDFVFEAESMELRSVQTFPIKFRGRLQSEKRRNLKVHTRQ